MCSQEGIQLDGIFKELRKSMAFESSFHRLVAGQPAALQRVVTQMRQDLKRLKNGSRFRLEQSTQNDPLVIREL